MRRFLGESPGPPIWKQVAFQRPGWSLWVTEGQRLPGQVVPIKETQGRGGGEHRPESDQQQVNRARYLTLLTCAPWAGLCSPGRTPPDSAWRPPPTPHTHPGSF